MLYSYHSSLVIGMLLRLVGLKECGLGTCIIGLGSPMSKIGTCIGALLFQSSPPHKLGIPSWSGDQEKYTTLHMESYKYNLSEIKLMMNLIINRQVEMTLVVRPPVTLKLPETSDDRW